jgi:hypothetical protein
VCEEIKGSVPVLERVSSIEFDKRISRTAALLGIS